MPGLWKVPTGEVVDVQITATARAPLNTIEADIASGPLIITPMPGEPGRPIIAQRPPKQVTDALGRPMILPPSNELVLRDQFQREGGEQELGLFRERNPAITSTGELAAREGRAGASTVDRPTAFNPMGLVGIAILFLLAFS